MDNAQGQVNQQGDQGQSQDSLGWRAGLPDDLKNNETFTPYKTVGEFAKAHIETVTKAKELEGKLASSIPKLDGNATPEQKDAFFRALGRPDKPEEYEIAQPQDGAKIDEKLAAAAKTAFHANGLNKDQAKNLSAWWNTYIGEMVKAEVDLRAKERNEAEVKLKAELGDKYDASVEMVRRVWTKYSNSEFDAFVNETKIGNDPRLIRFMVNLAKLTGEDKSPPGGTARGEAQKGGIIYDKSPAPPGG